MIYWLLRHSSPGSARVEDSEHVPDVVSDRGNNIPAKAGWVADGTPNNPVSYTHLCTDKRVCLLVFNEVQRIASGT